MFKLKVQKERYNDIKNQLKLHESSKYSYLLTTNKDLVEIDKINIVFNESHIFEINNLLDSIVRGEPFYIFGNNEFGKRRVDSRFVQYFLVEGDIIYAIMSDTKMIVSKKLYELEEELNNKNFVRISKYCLVNIGKIQYIKPALNSKLNLLMRNNDEVVVNRTYLKQFKQALKID